MILHSQGTLAFSVARLPDLLRSLLMLGTDYKIDGRKAIQNGKGKTLGSKKCLNKLRP